MLMVGGGVGVGSNSRLVGMVSLGMGEGEGMMVGGVSGVGVSTGIIGDNSGSGLLRGGKDSVGRGDGEGVSLGRGDGVGDGEKVDLGLGVRIISGVADCSGVGEITGVSVTSGRGAGRRCLVANQNPAVKPATMIPKNNRGMTSQVIQGEEAGSLTSVSSSLSVFIKGIVFRGRGGRVDV